MNAAADRLEDRLRRLRGGQRRRHLQQLLETGAMARRPLRLLRGLDRNRGVGRECAEHFELGIVRPTAAAGLSDREDREHPPFGILEWHEQLVLRVPRIGLVRRLDLGHVARPGVTAPVERAVGDQERAAATELLAQQVAPRPPLIGTAEQGVTSLLAAVDIRDAEVVELRPVQVEHDGLELQRLGDRVDHVRQRALQIALAADHAGHLEQRLHARAAEGLLQFFLTPRTRSPHAQLLE